MCDFSCKNGYMNFPGNRECISPSHAHVIFSVVVLVLELGYFNI